MISVTAELPDPPLSWNRQDIEQRCGFRGGRFTRVNNWFTLLVGFAATVAFYLGLACFPHHWLAQSFTQNGPTPYAIAFFSSWSLVILAVKWRKLALQR